MQPRQRYRRLFIVEKSKQESVQPRPPRPPRPPLYERERVSFTWGEEGRNMFLANAETPLRMFHLRAKQAREQAANNSSAPTSAPSQQRPLSLSR